MSSTRREARIDAPHPAARPRRTAREARVGVDGRAAPVPTDLPPLSLRADDLLYGQAADLIARLQRWAETLDEREAGLNAREAALDRRTRQHRLAAEQWALRQRRSAESQAEGERDLARKLAAAALALGTLENGGR